MYTATGIGDHQESIDTEKNQPLEDGRLKERLERQKYADNSITSNGWDVARPFAQAAPIALPTTKSQPIDFLVAGPALSNGHTQNVDHSWVQVRSDSQMAVGRSTQLESGLNGVADHSAFSRSFATDYDGISAINANQASLIANGALSTSFLHYEPKPDIGIALNIQDQRPAVEEPINGKPTEQIQLLATRESENVIKKAKRGRKPGSRLVLSPDMRIAPGSSIPSSIRQKDFARQAILATHSSRLDPFTLHPGELLLLKGQLTVPQVTVYLNIRNAILRLWTRSPLVRVSRDEALGCAKEARHFPLASFAHQWLTRNGYINFGCFSNPLSPYHRIGAGDQLTKQKVVVVVGAGMAGLGCARQLEALFIQYKDTFYKKGELLPQVIVLEGRSRIGGRIYSHPIQGHESCNFANVSQSRAEMGAHIVTGFQSGNPLNILIRGQLGLHVHTLKDESILYDYEGSQIPKGRDKLVEKLYNDILERVSVYRTKPASQHRVEGDRKLIIDAKDPVDEHGPILEDNSPLELRPERTVPSSESHVNGNEHFSTGSNATLGEVMDNYIEGYQKEMNLNAQDMRLFNWHYANLEYANAANVNQLSLGGWDQDNGNEFEGDHAAIKGGYIQVPRGLWCCPTKLQVEFETKVSCIKYEPESHSDTRRITVTCENGRSYRADHIVVSVPLGVLKSGTIKFEPELPGWKKDCIERLGFGLLNKIILVFNTPFWDTDKDMFGHLNRPALGDGFSQKDYSLVRGRNYLFWNCIKTSGVPTLIAIMAGDAAIMTENTDDQHLIAIVLQDLRCMFPNKTISSPVETIITRWGKDPLAKGSYSFVAKDTRLGDYETMARDVDGIVRFAGEATCGTHPATVHGAYISGLRAASEVADSILDPINVPQLCTTTVSQSARKQSLEQNTNGWSMNAGTTLPASRVACELEAKVGKMILNQLGDRPKSPSKPIVNPFLLYQKDYWAPCKADCDKLTRETVGDTNARASRAEVRAALGRNWRNAAADVKAPYLERTRVSRDQKAANLAAYAEDVKSWDRMAQRIRKEYLKSPALYEKTEEEI